MPVTIEQRDLSVAQGAAVEDWEKIEDAFRIYAFGVYYRRTFADERHALKRFVKALVASAQPIRDHQAVVEWYESRRRKKQPTENPSSS